jgi:DNA-binding NtrC family response regulator
MARILIIDDNPVIRSMLRMMLEDGGHEVDEAGNGNAGLAQFCAKASEVVITDLFMPEKQGMETIEELLKAAPGVKVIAISGGSGDLGDPHDYLNLARRMGAHATLRKPFQMDELLALIHRLLEGGGESGGGHSPMP